MSAFTTSRNIPEGSAGFFRHAWAFFSRGEKLLLVLFLITLPMINPWVRGDGVGYYAFARALLIEHRLDFRKDWLAANDSFRLNRIDASGEILPDQFTSTGHLDNHFSIGPAILWAPFVVTAHAAVLLADKWGASIPPDGFSWPYVYSIAFATALYGFLAIWISFRLARKYLPEKWALLAALGIWFGSSLPVYMYFNPSWSHAHSAFIVALFLWYWDRTRGARTWTQWIILGAIGGLMMDVYYLNALVLLVPLFEVLPRFWQDWRAARGGAFARLLSQNVLFTGVIVAAFLPTVISKKIIYGSYLSFGYGDLWHWNSPAFLRVCFSSEHGLFSWTPLLLLAVAGLFFLLRRDRELGGSLLLLFVIYLYTIGCYQDWAGISSYGNRFFVSLTPVFILGLAALFESLARFWQPRRAALIMRTATAFFIVWNVGLIYQWGMHLIPVRGPISWREATYNQVAVVPVEAGRTLENYMTRRKQMMNHIEQKDVKQLKSESSQ
ncbi:MAG: hypothetical protein ACRD5R_08110 [Candidatus Acidiferrales bacterium]